MYFNKMTQIRSSSGSGRIEAVGWRILLALVILVGSAGSAAAQGIDIPAIMNPDLNGPPTVVTATYGHQFGVDVDDAGTEIARDNAFLSVGHRFKVTDKASLFAFGSYTLQDYNFSSNSGNAYQWDDIHRVVIAALISYDINDRWRLIGGSLIRGWAEGGADFGDSLTGGMIAGFDYHPSEKFSVGLLLGAFSALEDSAGLLPVPTMKWIFAEDWRWDVGLVNTIGDPGVGTEITYQANEKVMVGGGFSFVSRRYRLDDNNNRVTGSPRSDKNGVGQETGAPLFAFVRWKPTKTSALDLMTGVTFAGNVRVESNTGGYIADDDYDPAPFVGLKGMIAF